MIIIFVDGGGSVLLKEVRERKKIKIKKDFQIIKKNPNWTSIERSDWTKIYMNNNNKELEIKLSFSLNLKAIIHNNNNSGKLFAQFLS